MRTVMFTALATAALAAAACAGCGSEDEYANADRPPAPVAISIAIVGERIAVSPDGVGAGPVVLLIANESRRSRDVVLDAPRRGGRSCVADDASSGPINPEDNARISLAVIEGTCEIGVADGTVAPARLTVGPERETAQQDLLQP
jgi:hypothetical protein